MSSGIEGYAAAAALQPAAPVGLSISLLHCAELVHHTLSGQVPLPRSCSSAADPKKAAHVAADTPVKLSQSLQVWVLPSVLAAGILYEQGAGVPCESAVYCLLYALSYGHMSAQLCFDLLCCGSICP